MIDVKFKKLHEGAQEPVYSSDDAACFDFFVPADTTVMYGDTALVKLGLAVEAPSNFMEFTE